MATVVHVLEQRFIERMASRFYRQARIGVREPGDTVPTLWRQLVASQDDAGLLALLGPVAVATDPRRVVSDPAPRPIVIVPAIKVPTVDPPQAAALVSLGYNLHAFAWCIARSAVIR